MNQITPVVEQVDGKVWTTSYEVARYFGKQHFHVMRDIEKLIQKKPELRGSNFGLTFEIKQIGNTKRRTPYYLIDKDGFTLLAMGFTGDKALDFKIAYIQAFNRMERTIQEGQLIGIHRFLQVAAKFEHGKNVASDAGRTLQAWKGAKGPLLETMHAIADESQLKIDF